MKNKNLISRLKDLKKSQALETVEGSMLQSVRGGKNGIGDSTLDPCGTKCKPNSACNGNN
ncbi:hypothetical protein [Chryseobacterium balustinum]|uniref:Bacteriocin n=1 Tax=Chryseobacterium balustinum TaxID=246 RepID=A0AAX2IQU0_9FLAO|nr:hypothetical protein [Chryseobacterium balustinum]AZB28678.1 hypothetical protein EB354_05055 [Chryseobacterium balustinum]SKC06850.1 hypothetical protein SAMN05421800_12616 [Chryseobacterium balustinum]SQA91812.1 Uncharacterised protein [Chryseobacterium balustinum]